LRTDSTHVVMAGLVPPAGPKPLRRGEGPAIHVFELIKKVRRGCPAQGRAWREPVAPDPPNSDRGEIAHL